jgi:hypothetical protein
MILFQMFNNHCATIFASKLSIFISLLFIFHVPAFFEPTRSNMFFDFKKAISRSAVGLLIRNLFAISSTVMLEFFSTRSRMVFNLFDNFKPSFKPSFNPSSVATAP